MPERIRDCTSHSTSTNERNTLRQAQTDTLSPVSNGTPRLLRADSGSGAPAGARAAR